MHEKQISFLVSLAELPPDRALCAPEFDSFAGELRDAGLGKMFFKSDLNQWTASITLTGRMALEQIKTRRLAERTAADAERRYQEERRAARRENRIWQGVTVAAMLASAAISAAVSAWVGSKCSIPSPSARDQVPDREAIRHAVQNPAEPVGRDDDNPVREPLSVPSVDPSAVRADLDDHVPVELAPVEAIADDGQEEAGGVER